MQVGRDIFIHLRTHTGYSLLEGALRIELLGGLCRAADMPACAVTDSGNMFGALEFAEALRAEGVQPIIGCTLPVLLPDVRSGRSALPVLAFLAKDEAGYRHLMKLTSLAHDSVKSGIESEVLHITPEMIASYAEGLICLTGGPRGLINHHLLLGDENKARSLVDDLAGIFSDRLYVELQRHDLDEEKRAEPWLIDIARTKGLGIVATNEVYFTRREDFEAHDALMCIAQGVKVSNRDRRQLTAEHYFKTGDEMAALFADLPEALANSVEIAQRSAFCPTPRDVILPRFTKEGENEADHLRKVTHLGLDERLAQLKEKSAPESEYRKRLDYELETIIEMGFAGYFLIVADFVQWAHKQSIPVGPGRGSGAGSLVAYALRITDLDPLRFGLIFERFLNPERISMPDFDIDFCQERRDEVIAYVRERYGEQYVAHIVTFGSLQARAVLRDVGRVLGMPYGQVDRLCKFVPNNPAHPVKLAEAIAGEPALQEARRQEPQVAQLLDISLKLEGLYRHMSTHAAGVVIGNRPLDELIPMSNDPRSGARLTQFSMKWVEQAGLVKFDLLGLKTLTVLRLTCELLAERGVELDLNAIALDDPKVYELLSRAETTGVFQLESGGVRDALRKIEPDRIEDLIALVALYRPGPMDNIPRYIDCKKGVEEVDYLHPCLEPVLRETFGVIIYQEQVMQIARTLSGYSAAEADLLRRAMGKKIKAEMDRHKNRFAAGARANNIEEGAARRIFDLVARFAGYGFNKSHAAAYALLAYQTAWLKTHHPVEFLAALMTLDIHNPEKVSHFKQEAARMGIEVSPPDINFSDARFTVRDGRIIHALAAVRNVGGEAAKAFAACRGDQMFSDIFDFAERCPTSALNKRAFESLAAAGAFDGIHNNRRQLFDHASRMIAMGRGGADSSQKALFDSAAQAEMALPTCEDWSAAEKLTQEFQAAGMYLSGHPLASWQEKLAEAGISAYEDLCAGTSHSGRLAGVITAVQERRSRKGNPFVFLSLSDLSGTYEVVIFADLLRKIRQFMETGVLVVVDVEVDREGEGLRLRAQSLKPLTEESGALRPSQRRQMQVRLFLERVEALDDVKRHLAGHPGGTRVHLVVPSHGGEVEIGLPGAFALSSEVRERLSAIPGVKRIEAA